MLSKSTSNILYESRERGIMIVLRREDVMLASHLSGQYPIIIARCHQTRFVRSVVSNKSTQTFKWVNDIILDTFKEIGYPVKPSIRDGQYSIIGKKQKFQFILKYGTFAGWTDK